MTRCEATADIWDVRLGDIMYVRYGGRRKVAFPTRRGKDGWWVVRKMRVAKIDGWRRIKSLPYVRLEPANPEHSTGCWRYPHEIFASEWVARETFETFEELARCWGRVLPTACAVALLCLLSFAGVSWAGLGPYTPTMAWERLDAISSSPWVHPTESSTEFVVGYSHGWPADPCVPQHELLGYRVGGEPSDCRALVVAVSGQHNTEHTGNRVLDGLVDFWISPDPRAARLRSAVDLLVYPMLNPDGRYLRSGRANPELENAGQTDHNRVWGLEGFSTIDAYTAAMASDVAGRPVDYFLDFHSAGLESFFYVTADQLGGPFTEALSLEGGPPPRVYAGHHGMAPEWAKRALGARYAYTPEQSWHESAEVYAALGESYGLALFDVLAPPLPGDCNYDNAVNGLDIEPLAAAIVAGRYVRAADLDGSGAVNGLDVGPFVLAAIASEAIAIPEPSARVLAVLGSMVFWPWRAKQWRRAHRNR